MTHSLVLRGSHVELVPLDSVDPAALLSAATEDRRSYDWTWVPADPHDLERYLATARADEASGRSRCFAQVVLPGRRVVGSTRFMDIQRAGDDIWSVEIGSTWLAASVQRTAVNTEAKLLLLRHAFETWGVQRVQLKTDVRNTASRAAIERLGARFEGILRHHMPSYHHQGPRDSAMYSLLPDEWPEVRARLLRRLSARGPNDRAG